MSSLSEVVSFAFSGATAKALASLITSNVLVSPAPTSSKIDPPSQPSATPPPPPKTRFSSSGLIQHIDSVVFFIVLTVASTRIAKLHDEHCSTGRAAAEAFVSGAAAGLCMRIVTDVAFHNEKGRPTPGSKFWSPGAGGHATADRRRQLASRFTWRALEEDLVLCLDPALTSCLYKVLDTLAIKKAAVKNKSRSVADHAEITATTFVVAALSKAIATTVTYPLQTAKLHREQQAEADAEGQVGASGTKEKSGSTLPSHKATETGFGTNRRLLFVLWRFARAEGFLAVYAGWLSAVALASLGHGITKAGQELLEKLVKKLTYVLAGAWGALALRPPNSDISRPSLSSSTQIRQPPGRGVPGLRQQQQQRLQQQLLQQQQPLLRQRLVVGHEQLRSGMCLPTPRQVSAQSPPPLLDQPLPWPRGGNALSNSAAHSCLATQPLDATLRVYRPSTESAWSALQPAEKYIWHGTSG